VSLHVLGVAASEEPGGRTATAVAAILEGARAAGAATALAELAESGPDETIKAFASADAVVFGSAVYRASFSGMLKNLLERTERGRWGERSAPLQGKAAAIVLTGASAHHYLALCDLRAVLAGFFAVQVLSPGLYYEHCDFAERTRLGTEGHALAVAHGAALADLGQAVRDSAALQAVSPQV
jgi:FMN reductase